MGAGLLGLATARALAARLGGPAVAVLEAEGRVAAHQSGHNSGVLHAGLYYTPGSGKARFCRQGRRALQEYALARGLPFERCGKLVVATSPAEEERLDALEARGRENGLEGLERLGPDGIRAREPEVAGRSALLVPETAILDFRAVAAALADDLRTAGAAVCLDAAVTTVARDDDGRFVLRTPAGAVRARRLVNCAGLQADRVARLLGERLDLTLVPFRGEYQRLVPAARRLVRHVVYPVPDPALPFLGVHFTRTVGGDIEVGPNAVLTFSRRGYTRGAWDWADAREMFAHGGVRRLLLRHARTGLGELLRSRSRRAALAAMRRLVPALGPDDLEPAGSGVRAQAVDAAGRLVDDFQFRATDGALHVLNAPSPAATSCLALGEEVAGRLLD